MSEQIDQETTFNPDAPKTFQECVPKITEKYLNLVKLVQEKLKYHHDLSGAFEAGLRSFQERLDTNFDQVLYNLSDNFLYCLEPLFDSNVDYFLYQVDKIKKKNGKVEKVKISRLIGKAQMKIILKEVDEETRKIIFNELQECFEFLTYLNENNECVFFDEYVEFVKENLHDSKNYSKMIVSIDNVDSIICAAEYVPEAGEMNLDSDSEDEKEGGKKKGKKGGMEDQFMKGLENTKIAKLAKNISEKMNPDDFPMLSDPTKLLSSISSPESGDGVNGIGNLLKFVVNEVQTALSQEDMNEADLINEATSMMGNLKGMGGFDPFQMFKNMAEGGAGPMGGGGGVPEGMPDMSQFAGIFEGLNKTLGEEMKKAVGEVDTQKKGKKMNKKE